jgi:predicted extracellular nuclease
VIGLLTFVVAAAKRGVVLVFAVVVLAVPSQVVAASSNVVVSQVYGGGGNTGAPYANDYVELFNRGLGAVPLTGWSIQYASATGTGNFGANTGQLTELSGFIGPGEYRLVQEAGGAVGAPLPTADVTDATPINMSATGGKVAVVNSTAPLGCNGSSTPCSASALATIVDLVGYDGANFFEGAGAAPAASNTTAVLRNDGGCADTDNNGADFAAGAPTPRNAASPTRDCTASTNPTGVGSATPSSVEAGASVTLKVAVAPGTNPTSTGLNVIADISAIGGTTGQVFYDDGTHGDQVAGDNTFTFATVVAPGTAPGVKSMPALVGDAQGRNSFAQIQLEVLAPTTPTPIHDIQGAAHTSPLSGQLVANVLGIVTAKRTNGYYLQDPNPDANPATSEGIFVFTSSAPSSVNVGDSVRVDGRVSEFRPGGSSSTNLTTTEIVTPTTTVLSSGNALPSPIVVGSTGRIPPGEVIEDDATGNVETSGAFDPDNDGIDFYESLEGMRVEVDDAVAVGPTNAFGETPVLGDNGANAGLRTARGGIVVRPNDFNPERIVLDDVIVGPVPAANVGDHYPGASVGVLDYNFGNFMVELTSVPAVVHDGVTPETTAAQGTTQLAIGTFNVENLDPTDPPTKFARLAGLIVNNLAAPDVLTVEEVQDNSGPTDNGVVDATTTLDMLVAAIQSAGGPTYSYRYVNPVNDADGGEPGGNIRQVFLFRTDRGLSFVDRPGGGPTTATTVVNGASGPELSASPGRIDPTNTAFTTSRKPLAGEFLFRGHHLFVIGNHFNSKGGDEPLFGRSQPPTRSSEVQRHAQAQVVHDFVASILAADPNAGVVVDGDLNDFEFSDAVTTLKAGALHDLIDGLPANERYSYVFEGNSQTLDHVLLSDALFGRPIVFDVVHVNAEFADQASDHDPSVARITLNDPPEVDAGGPYAVDEGSSLTLSATGTDPEGGPLTYEWDLDGNGTFETPGQSATFVAPDGPAAPTVKVRVADEGGLSDVEQATITVRNVAPTATFVAPVSSPAGFAFTLSLTSPHDPSAADTAAGFTYAFDCGTDYGAFGSTASASCPTTDVGTRSVGAKIRDKDGGVTEYRASVEVFVTYASLCDLVRAYATDASVADGLCDKLAMAATAPTAGARQGLLEAFGNQVDAKTGAGKTFTDEQGALLKRLSTKL